MTRTGWRLSGAQAVAAEGSGLTGGCEGATRTALARGVVTFAGRAQCASGSGRSWKWTAMGFWPLPPSMSHGARSPLVHDPRSFHPAFDSAVEALGVEAERVGDAQHDHLAVHCSRLGCR
jgi:hypothetical protein